MTAGEADKVGNGNSFRKTLVRVLIVQVVALALLWVKEHGAEALEAYEAQWPAWLGHEEIAIRDLAIRCLPRPLPEVALEHLETLVQDDDKQLRITALQADRRTRDARFRDPVPRRSCA